MQVEAEKLREGSQVTKKIQQQQKATSTSWVKRKKKEDGIPASEVMFSMSRDDWNQKGNTNIAEEAAQDREGRKKII